MRTIQSCVKHRKKYSKPYFKEENRIFSHSNQMWFSSDHSYINPRSSSAIIEGSSNKNSWKSRIKIEKSIHTNHRSKSYPNPNKLQRSRRRAGFQLKKKPSETLIPISSQPLSHSKKVVRLNEMVNKGHEKKVYSESM